MQHVTILPYEFIEILPSDSYFLKKGLSFVQLINTSPLKQIPNYITNKEVWFLGMKADWGFLTFAVVASRYKQSVALGDRTFRGSSANPVSPPRPRMHPLQQAEAGEPRGKPGSPNE